MKLVFACWLCHVQLEVLMGSGQERYPAHGLWPGLARPLARIPTASGQGCSRLKAGVSDKKQSKKQFEIFELFFSKKIFKEYFRVLFLNKSFRNIFPRRSGLQPRARAARRLVFQAMVFHTCCGWWFKPGRFKPWGRLSGRQR